MGFLPERIYEGTSWRRKHGEPKNRKQLFQCVLTDQFFSLVPVNLLYLLFWVPAMALTAFCLLQLVICMQEGNGARAIATINTWALGLIPCLTIIGPARAGMALVMRDWAREDYSKVLPTFFKGMKENWKGTLVVSFLAATLPMAIWSAYQMCAQGSKVLLIVVCVAAALYLMVLQVYFTLLVTYDLRPKHHFRNALLFFLMHLPSFFLVFVGTGFVAAVSILFSFLYPDRGYVNLLIPVIYYSVIGLAVTELANASLANMLCDTHFADREEETVDQVPTESTLQKTSETLKSED